MADKQIIWLRRLVCSYTIILIWLTLPLWSVAHFPRVPFLRSLAEIGLVYIALFGLFWPILFVALRSNLTQWIRRALLALVVIFALMISLDQHRLQPWAYQFWLLFVLLAGAVEADSSLAAARTKIALRWARVLTISIYAYSALFKLDQTFVYTHGQQLLAGLMQNFGIETSTWSSTARVSLAFCMPLGELVTAGMLCFPSTRRAGVVCSMLMHVTLMLAVCPWGLNHKPAVLVWNSFFILQNALLFWPKSHETSDIPNSHTRRPAPSWRAKTSYAILTVACVLPLFQPWGLCDVWPAWGLYSARPARVRFYVDDRVRDRLPEEIARFTAAAPVDSNWCRVRLDLWSLEATDAPIYPQDRFRIAVALAVIERYELGEFAKVVHESASDWKGSQRSISGHEGIEQIRELATRFTLNTTSPY